MCLGRNEENMPKISIVIPVYNVEKYLRKCLDSVQNQTLKDIEIICVDDGSTDLSGIILDEYAEKDSRFHIVHKKNEGYGKAMNVGIGLSTAPYVGVVESDDWIEPDMYEKMLALMKVQKVDILKTDFYRFYDNGEGGYIEEYIPLILERILWNLYEKKISVKEYEEVFRFHRYTWTGLYNRDFLEREHILHNETPGASYQDNGFWFQTMVKANSMYFTKQAFYHYRIDNPESSMNSKEKAYALCVEYDFIHNILESMGNEGRKYYRWCNYIKFMDSIRTLNRVAEEFKEGLTLRIKRELLETESGEIDSSMFRDEWKIKIFDLVTDSKTYLTKESERDKKIQDIASKYETIIIYGAGKLGQAVLSYLKERYFGTKVKYFAVTDLGGNSEFVSGIPIRRIKSLSGYKESALVIMAVGSNSVKEIQDVLKTENFKNFIRIDNFMEQDILQYYLEINKWVII